MYVCMYGNVHAHAFCRSPLGCFNVVNNSNHRLVFIYVFIFACARFFMDAPRQALLPIGCIYFISRRTEFQDEPQATPSVTDRSIDRSMDLMMFCAVYVPRVKRAFRCCLVLRVQDCNDNKVSVLAGVCSSKIGISDQRTCRSSPFMKGGDGEKNVLCHTVVDTSFCAQGSNQ